MTGSKLLFALSLLLAPATMRALAAGLKAQSSTQDPRYIDPFQVEFPGNEADFLR